jgi:hypothetical protein
MNDEARMNRQEHEVQPAKHAKTRERNMAARRRKRRDERDERDPTSRFLDPRRLNPISRILACFAVQNPFQASILTRQGHWPIIGQQLPIYGEYW